MNFKGGETKENIISENLPRNNLYVSSPEEKDIVRNSMTRRTIFF
jgi:hypothetical protein